MSSTLTELPSTLNAIGLDVTFAAYLAVVLGTFIPVVFLITLYIQSESRKAGAAENP